MSAGESEPRGFINLQILRGISTQVYLIFDAMSPGQSKNMKYPGINGRKIGKIAPGDFLNFVDQGERNKRAEHTNKALCGTQA